MKRLLIAFGIFAAATVLVRALRSETVQAAKATIDRRELWRVQSRHLEEMRGERDQLRERTREAKRQAAEQAPVRTPDELAAEFTASGLKNLSPEKAERLLAELGFNWTSTGDFLVVSKTSLPEIGVSAIRRGGTLGAAARAALAITPDEQATIEAETQRLASEYNSWVQTHAQREEPSGKIVAKYVLTADPEYSETASNAFAGVTLSTLGPQRAALLQQYSWNWKESLGMFVPAPGDNDATSLTIRRDGDSLMLELRQSMSSMSCTVSPAQPMPEPFRPLFPGGWKELAEREGFELPKEFQTEKR
jgi:hypothetical protein